MNAFQLRLELLRMAKDMLESDYFGKREIIANQFAMDCDDAKSKGETTPKHPGYPNYPAESEIIAKATSLNAFLSMTSEPIKPTTKKSV